MHGGHEALRKEDTVKKEEKKEEEKKNKELGGFAALTIPYPGALY